MSPMPPGLQPERTALAWRRLGLAMAAGGLLAGRLAGAAGDAWAVLVGLVAAGVAVALMVVSHLDLLRADRPAGHERTPYPELVLAGVAVLMLAATGIALTVG